MKPSIILMIVVSSVMLGSTMAQEPVTFADETLKTAVEDALWLYDPTPADMLSLRELSCVNQGVTDITGLEYAENLQTLNLRFNEIHDISLLAGLGNLQTLSLSRNQVTDLSPLSGLDNLRYLDLHGNDLRNITELSGLSRLETLVLRFNQLSNISALAGLHNLQSLDLHENQLSDITPLAGLTKLQNLDLYDNQVSDISVLSGLIDLRSLDLRFNQVRDVSVLCNMQSLSHLYLGNNDISSIDCLAELTELKDLYLRTNQITDIYALLGLMKLQTLDIRWNPINDEAFCSHLSLIVQNNPGIVCFHDGECDLSPQSYVLTISSSSGGTVVDPGEGDFTVDRGTSIVVRAQTLDNHSLFQTWTGTAADAGAVDDPHDPNTLVRIDSNHTLKANFLENISYVDDDAPADPSPGDPGDSDPQEDGTEGHPFDSIQEAITAAPQGAWVLVNPGTYAETVNLLGKPIHVTGLHPTRPTLTDLPVISGKGTDTLLVFDHGEDAGSQVSGLVLTGGRGNLAGAIACLGSSPTIRNCLIVGNRCDNPQGGIVYCRDSHPVFENLTVQGNRADQSGAAFRFVNSSATISNSILWDNRPEEIVVESGVDPTIRYSDVMGTWPGAGNRAFDPDFVLPGFWTTASQDSQIMWIPGNYRLMSQSGRWDLDNGAWVSDIQTSPCIDAADPNLDFVNETTPHGGRRNMGAYGGTTQASHSYRSALAHWRFDETSGDKALDAAGNSDAEVHGAVWTSGKINGALQFDGVNDYVDCGNRALLAPTRLTLALWIYPQASFASRTVLQKGDTETEDYRFELFGAQHPTFSFGAGLNRTVLYANTTVNRNEWAHITLTRDGQEVKLYINGVQTVSQAYAFVPSATDHHLIIGGADAYPYQGKIDDVRLYGFSLSNEEVGHLVSETE